MKDFALTKDLSTNAVSLMNNDRMFLKRVRGLYIHFLHFPSHLQYSLQTSNHSCQSLLNLTRYSQIQFQTCCKLHLNACSSAASGSLCVIITVYYIIVDKKHCFCTKLYTPVDTLYLCIYISLKPILFSGKDLSKEHEFLGDLPLVKKLVALALISSVICCVLVRYSRM